MRDEQQQQSHESCTSSCSFLLRCCWVSSRGSCRLRLPLKAGLTSAVQHRSAQSHQPTGSENKPHLYNNSYCAHSEAEEELADLHFAAVIVISVNAFNTCRLTLILCNLLLRHWPTSLTTSLPAAGHAHLQPANDITPTTRQLLSYWCSHSQEKYYKQPHILSGFHCFNNAPEPALLSI